MIIELGRCFGSERAALKTVGLARSSWYYRQHPRDKVENPIHQSERAYESRVSSGDRELIRERILLAWSERQSVDYAFATTWDEGIMVASRRTWWRIAECIEDQSLRPLVPSRKDKRAPRNAPVLKASAPGKVWSGISPTCIPHGGMSCTRRTKSLIFSPAKSWAG